VSPTGNASGTRRLHSIQPDPSAGRGAGPCGTAAIRGTRGLDAAPYRETLCMQWQRAVVLEHVVFAGGEVASQPACTHLPVDGSVEPSMPAARAVSRTGERRGINPREGHLDGAWRACLAGGPVRRAGRAVSPERLESDEQPCMQYYMQRRRCHQCQGAVLAARQPAQPWVSKVWTVH
jgi:hypothetical protein